MARDPLPDWAACREAEHKVLAEFAQAQGRLIVTRELEVSWYDGVLETVRFPDDPIFCWVRETDPADLLEWDATHTYLTPKWQVEPTIKHPKLSGSMRVWVLAPMRTRDGKWVPASGWSFVTEEDPDGNATN